MIGHNNKLAREVSSDNTIYLTNYKYTGNLLYIIHLLNSKIIFFYRLL